MTKSPMVRCAFVFLAGVACLADCRAAVPGGGDDIDERIDNAMAGVRRDRPWRLAGAPSVNDPLRLRSYDPTATAAIARRQSGWQYSVTPFFWIPAVSGSQKVNGQEVEIDSDMGDTLSGVLENFEFAAMGRFEARHCKWSILFDFMYVGLGNEDTLDVAAAQIDVEWDFDLLVAEAFVGYRFAELPLGCGSACFRPTVSFDALAGARYYHLGADVDLDPGPSFDGSKDWIDPVVGVRALFHVTPDLTFNVFGNVGGFGIGSDLSWQLIAGVDYQVGKCVSLNAGWMVLDVDYESGSFEFDVNMSGPYVGATFRF